MEKVSATADSHSSHFRSCYKADGDLKSPLKSSDQTYREKLEQDLNTVSTISKLTESVSIPHQVRVNMKLKVSQLIYLNLVVHVIKH